jgi:single-stranded-DNA-specific exonuclease
MKNREIDTFEKANLFLNPSIKNLRDPFLMKDMRKSVDRIKKAIENNEKIWIFGDYDVDGVSSVSILSIYFKDIQYPIEYYIPNRLEEGYGISEDAIREINSKGCDLLISVDCGITSVKEVELANSLGMDVIITDHHECQDEIPNAFAVINPKQSDCEYPFKMLCGCGIALKLIQALTPKEEFESKIQNYIEIASLATICDVMPVVDENRIIVKNGLKSMQNCVNLGLRELIKVCGISADKIGTSHIGFSIGPRINATGRLGFSNLGVELFTTEFEDEAMELAQMMETKNIERQNIELKITKEVEDIIKSDKNYENEKVIVVAGEGWQHGIIGIVSSKLTEKYYKPTILMCIDGEEATGSARSIKGFNIFEAIFSCGDILKKFGGHEQAAGLTVETKNISKLRRIVNEFADEFLNKEDLIEKVDAEFEIEPEHANIDFVRELHILEPFGIQNPSPKFIMRDVEIKNIFRMGKEKQHLKIIVKKESSKIDENLSIIDSEISKSQQILESDTSKSQDMINSDTSKQPQMFEFDCVGFNMAHIADKFEIGDRIDVLFQINENTYMGKTKVQFLLKDVREFYSIDKDSEIENMDIMRKIISNSTEKIGKLSFDNKMASVKEVNNEDIKETTETKDKQISNIEETTETKDKQISNIEENNKAICDKKENNCVNTFELEKNIYSPDININIFDHLKEKTLILVSSIHSLKRVISDVSLLDIKYNVYLDNKKNVDKNDNIHIMFTQDIDKINLKRYNSIILYDYLINASDYEYLFKQKNSNEIVKYYDRKNLVYTNRVIKEIVPVRDDFTFVYKKALIEKNINIETTLIRQTFNMSTLKFFVVLNVFKELSLLDYREEENKITISLLPKPNQKLDLNNSLMLQYLCKLQKIYIESFKIYTSKENENQEVLEQM